MRLGKNIATAKEALKQIQSCERIFIGSGAASPYQLVQALTSNKNLFQDNEIIHIAIFDETPYVCTECNNHFRHNALFISGSTREAVGQGRADYTPIFLSEIPKLFKSGRLPLGAALIQVAPHPEDPSRYSLGVSVDVVKAAMSSARLVIAQVNSEMPYTLGEAEIHRNDIDYLFHASRPLPELTDIEPNAIEMAIGSEVASLIPNGATLQLGIGKIPDAVAKCLSNKKNLGIHTEMFSDGVLDLYEKGCISGTQKAFDKKKIVTSFVYGSKRLYDWLHLNPDVEFYPSDYTNDPRNISQHDNMVAINSAIEVDLTGQVVSDSMGHSFYSGIGGQVDYIRGAKMATNGIPVIAMPSTAKKESISRIQVSIRKGAGVVTSRGDVHYIVTEYGIADLFGKTIEERALSLIEIAHPKFRAQLLKEAKANHLIHQDEPEFLLDLLNNKSWSAKIPFHGGSTITFRPIKPSDERNLQTFFYSHSQESIYKRYGFYKRNMNHNEAISRIRIENEKNMVIIATKSSNAGSTICGLARYNLLDKKDTAEIAIILGDEYQGKGLGSQLLSHLINIAKTNHVKKFVFNIQHNNKGMLTLFQKHFPNGSTGSIEDGQLEAIGQI